MEDIFYTKTEAGRREIKTRQHKMSMGLRSLLLVIDGQRSGEQLRAVIMGLRAPPDSLKQLRDLGLIERAGATPEGPVADTPPLSETANRYGILYALMTDVVRENLGVRGYFFQLKIERAEDAEALLGLMPDLRAALTKARGEDYAEQWEDHLRALVEA
ncbi:hypothetical protein [Pseudofulvimonas gallinarii]|jgi:hypothetical protein|uniref:Uncharacterized protein n=1 Tax=Pseudofulvimonas gallinarii TaxID=634155 RepID=A0A4R3LM46_9GAMM|nr:hypothetical protein [Pseudofulvimonas gallinarii]TCT01372.1 hypothetical protein EDC25_101239 [Pseudofulvimonas gallinarii]THD15123.1 hypothetical protein B1808_01675 [Pseudofulvimonas gallinarii]